jgi:archaellum biogenesis protein FlaJ (TadC family)
LKRILEIVHEVKRIDNFFSNFAKSCQSEPSKKKYYQMLNKALMTLDDKSWGILKNKAIEQYTNE